MMCVGGEAAAAEEAEGLPGAEVPASALERLQQVPPYPSTSLRSMDILSYRALRVCLQQGCRSHRPCCRWGSFACSR